MKYAELKINGTVPGHTPGQVVKIEVDDNGTPLQKHWRDRLRDAVTDDCVTLIQPKQTKPKRTATEEAS